MKELDERNLIIICITVILCVLIASATVLFIHYNTHTSDNKTNESVNKTLNDSNNTTSTASKKSSTSQKNNDPDYGYGRDDSHKYATEDNPVTVQQSDGEYTYYGPGHFD